MTLKTDGYLNIFFHPWEFADLSAYKLPWYTKQPNGKILLSRLEKHLRWLQTKAIFTTKSDFVEKWYQQHEVHE
jgi:hypothetical protein